MLVLALALVIVSRGAAFDVVTVLFLHMIVVTAFLFEFEQTSRNCERKLLVLVLMVRNFVIVCE